MGIYKRSKNTDKPLIRQILDFIPLDLFQNCVKTYSSDKGCSRYKSYDQLVALTFGQLNDCDSLSSISTGIGIDEGFISALGLKQSPAKSTMSDGNKNRSYKFLELLYSKLQVKYNSKLKLPSELFTYEKFEENYKVKIIDSTVISVCLNMFEWAKFRTAKGGIKIHTVLNEATLIPEVVNITEAKKHDRYGLKQLIYPKNTVILEDRGYFDFSLIAQRIASENTFVTRIKTNTVYKTIKELDLPEKKHQHVLKDELIQLVSPAAKEAKIDKHTFRLVHVYLEEQNKTIEIITNNITWKAITIADLYKKRWAIETFFRTLKQNLKVKTFWGTSENAVKSQIYVALICNLLIEFIKRVICKHSQAFSVLTSKIRMFLTMPLTINYICNNIKPVAQYISCKNPGLFDQKMDLFSG